jgi:hypothetical protein
MRHTVRPFIKEFKGRSSRSLKPHPQTMVDTDKSCSKQPLLDPDVSTAYKKSHDSEYKAALEVADAVFGRSNALAPVQANASSSNAHAGRVLPSLIEKGDAPTIRLTEVNENSRRVRKAKSSSSRQGKNDVVAEASIERATTNISPETVNFPASRREHRSIQKRWVLKTELKAGQKWKRRLPKAAR